MGEGAPWHPPLGPSTIMEQRRDEATSSNRGGEGEAPRSHGVCDSWNVHRGYGFIRSSSTGPASTTSTSAAPALLFVHFRDLEKCGQDESSFKGLSPGTAVEFSVTTQNGKARAVRVTGPRGAALPAVQTPPPRAPAFDGGAGSPSSSGSSQPRWDYVLQEDIQSAGNVSGRRYSPNVDRSYAASRSISVADLDFDADFKGREMEYIDLDELDAMFSDVTGLPATPSSPAARSSAK